MPSQEDYLDSLLKDLNGDKTDKESVEELRTEEKHTKQKQSEEPQLDMSDIEALLKSVEAGDSEIQQAPDLEQVQKMSQEDIERLLASEGSGGKEEVPAADPDQMGQEDVMNLLDQSDDADLQEIRDLLQKSDNNEAVENDLVSLVPGEEEPSEPVPDRKRNREAAKQAKRAEKEARKAEKKALREAKKAHKSHKNEQNAEAFEQPGSEESDTPLSDAEDSFQDVEIPENESADMEELLNLPDIEELEEEKQTPKKGFFSRILDLLTEEDEEEEGENEEIKLSDENKEILKEMDQEKGKKKAGKSGKKKKNASGKETGSEGEAEASSKGKKAKKEKKPKKEKPQKEPQVEVYEEPKKKLSAKRIALIAMTCLSFGLAVIIIAAVSGEFMSKKEGREAYYAGDYQTCYQTLFGKELNESEKVMFCKSESILRIRLWLREYKLFADEGAEVEALDSLLQSVHDYPALQVYSAQWNASDEVAAGYAEIVRILSEKYHLTEEQAKEIYDIPEDAEYTRAVTAIAQGTAFDEWKNPENQEEMPEPVQEPLLDELPEEMELPDETFVDNNPR